MEDDTQASVGFTAWNERPNTLCVGGWGQRSTAHECGFKLGTRVTFSCICTCGIGANGFILPI